MKKIFILLLFAFVGCAFSANPDDNNGDDEGYVAGHEENFGNQHQANLEEDEDNLRNNVLSGYFNEDGGRIIKEIMRNYIKIFPYARFITFKNHYMLVTDFGYSPLRDTLLNYYNRQIGLTHLSQLLDSQEVEDWWYECTREYDSKSLKRIEWGKRVITAYLFMTVAAFVVKGIDSYFNKQD